MPTIEKEVLHQDTGKKVSQTHTCPDTIQACIDKYGSAVVLSHFTSSIGNSLRNRLSNLTHGRGRVTRENAIKMTKDWMPGMSSTRISRSPMGLYLASLEGLSEEEKRESFLELREKMEEG